MLSRLGQQSLPRTLQITRVAYRNTQCAPAASQLSNSVLLNAGMCPPVKTASLSTAAAAEMPPPRRRTRSLDPIVVTESAAERIKELLAGESAEGAIGIRLGVKRRGCNGLSYTLNYAFEKPEKDEEMTAHGVRVFIEPMALFNVVGTTMDWEETELSSEFTFKNPNSKGECGCGESFNV